MIPIKEKPAAGINPISQTHFTDHLAVICYIMNIPLIFLDPSDHTLAQHYYPGLNAQYVEYDNFSPEYLVSNYEVLFMSDMWDNKSFHAKFAQLEMKYGKEMRHIFCPHGFSDKGFYLKLAAQEDIVLTYGQNMLDQLEHHNVLHHMKNIVITGNYRYTYYKEHQQFYDDLVTNEVLKKFIKEQPVILYAPTWSDFEDSTTFFDCCSEIIGNLPSSYNMIVKLHPRLELDDAGKYFSIIGKYERKPNLVFLKDFPPGFPQLAHTDIYLGDMSSIGYDFLKFNKPMFFLNKNNRDAETDRGLYLFRCGTEIKADGFNNIYKIIEDELKHDHKKFTKIRNEIYEYTFGNEIPFSKIKNEIIEAYNQPQGSYNGIITRK